VSLQYRTVIAATFESKPKGVKKSDVSAAVKNALAEGAQNLIKLLLLIFSSCCRHSGRHVHAADEGVCDIRQSGVDSEERKLLRFAKRRFANKLDFALSKQSHGIALSLVELTTRSMVPLGLLLPTRNSLVNESRGLR
jgi:hypothetical protein